jgi:hypothetical protein
MRPQDNLRLLHAFPTSLSAEALPAISVLPKNPHGVGNFTVQVNNEAVLIPYRVYHDTAMIHTDKLSSMQKHLVDCILTRHHDGFVRQKRLAQIVSSNYAWVPPFVIQLLGEYVVEILHVIEANLGNLDKALYTEFLRANPDFLALTEQRVISYWDCYYRFSCIKEDYPGFRAVHFFKQLVKDEGRKTG